MAKQSKGSAPQSLSDIPHFSSEDEEDAYWSQHSTAALMDSLQDVSDEPPAELRPGPGREGSRAKKRPERMKLISLYLHEDQIAGAKAIAAERGVAYQALLRGWIGERLDKETRARGTASAAELLRLEHECDADRQASAQIFAALERAEELLANEPSAEAAALSALIDAQQHELRMQQQSAAFVQGIIAAAWSGLDMPNAGSPWLAELYRRFAPVRQEAEEAGYTEAEINEAIDQALAGIRAKSA